MPDGQEEEIWEIQTFPHVKIKKKEREKKSWEMRPADKSSVKGEEKTREEEERTIPDMSTYHRLEGLEDFTTSTLGRRGRPPQRDTYLFFSLSLLYKKRKRIELMESLLSPFWALDWSLRLNTCTHTVEGH